MERRFERRSSNYDFLLRRPSAILETQFEVGLGPHLPAAPARKVAAFFGFRPVLRCTCSDKFACFRKTLNCSVAFTAEQVRMELSFLEEKEDEMQVILFLMAVLKRNLLAL